MGFVREIGFRRKNMQLLLAASSGSSCFLRVHNNPLLKKSRPSLLKPYCRQRQQKSKTTSWPSVSLSLFGTGFFLGPIIDGLHSRVNLVVYKSGSIDVGPLHTNIWVGGLLLFPHLQLQQFLHSWCYFISFILSNWYLPIGSIVAWVVLLHTWVATALPWWKGLKKGSRGKFSKINYLTDVYKLVLLPSSVYKIHNYVILSSYL